MIKNAVSNQKDSKRYRSIIARELAKKSYPRKHNTFCPVLFNSVFISANGEVFTCCLAKLRIGNIYKHNLSYLWSRSRNLKLFRWLALHKSLPCISGCSLMSKREKNQAPRKELLTRPYPAQIQIEHTLFCTIACIMCRQNHSLKLSLDSGVLKRNIDWNKVSVVILQGGEIFALKESKDLYRWLTEKMHKEVLLVTNGLLMNHAWAHRLMKHSKRIEISVNAATKRTHELVNRGSHFETVIAHIHMLRDLKRRLSSPTELLYHFTIVRENIHEIAEAIGFADRLGCDEINFSYDEPTLPKFLRKNKKLRDSIGKKITRRIKKGDLRVRIRYNHLEQLGFIRYFECNNFIENTLRFDRPQTKYEKSYLWQKAR